MWAHTPPNEGVMVSLGSTSIAIRELDDQVRLKAIK